jgi:L-2-hydroxyglutarate oxidase LhgO
VDILSQKVENPAYELKTSQIPARRLYDLVIVGGGIVGLATAREFLLRYPRLQLLVVEKEENLASHQSGHNSGVIHAGIYYAPGSLKAKACVAGRAALLDYCRERGIPFELSGKLIVALDESELPALNELMRRGIANGVQGLEMVDAARLREIEPYAAGIKAIWSPATGIIDYRLVALSYAADILKMGGEIITGNEVVSLASWGEKTVISSRTRTRRENQFEALYVVTCGGLQSDKLANLSGAPDPANRVKIVPFRGDYYVLRPEKRRMVRSMIYPVPDPQFPFLGVHFTRRMDGEVWAGPNAVLAFAREGYTRWRVRPAELAESLAYPGFQKLALKYWRMGATEMYRDYLKAAYVKALVRYMPTITGDDLLPGPSGVRAQALAPDGKLVDDFLIRHGKNVVHVQNAPSPAATSSLVIGQMIVDDAAKNFNL